MAIHILGIRHHGVGSAKNVADRLALIKPDIILVEGPPEISEMLLAIGHANLVPPAAIMCYNTDNPKESVFYPFAEYSPEWVAAQYANKHGIPVKAIDLPVSISLAQKREAEEANPEEAPVSKDPLGYLADIAGFGSGEEWWEYHFEQQKENTAEHFEAVMHVMESLRAEGVESSLDKENVPREAYMRTLIRQCQNEIYTNIAVICGAWHAPALLNLDGTAKSDAKILKVLPKSKVKVTATWIPWTNSRLSMSSGYGAGIYSPGWYEHQWHAKDDAEITWLTKVATALRDKQIDISTAHVIEAFVLSRSLSSLRNKYYVSLEELNEATLSVMCMGDGILLELIKKELIIGSKLGRVPEELPKVPLQEDFEQNLKSLRLKLTAEQKQYDLDLRKEIDLGRSILFFRLEVLGIPWARRTVSRSKGTFKESWFTEWSPDMMIELIDKAFLGNTIESASQSVILGRCAQTQSIAEVSELIQKCIPAELFEGIDALLDRIVELSTVSSDIIDLMNALPALIEVSRYGNVRKSDLSILETIVKQLLVKVYIGLNNACYGLDEDNSTSMFSLITKLNNAIRLYDDTEYLQQWHETLHKMVDNTGVHPIILGCVCRLLLDSQQMDEQEVDKRIAFALSVSNDPYQVASWLEGFLKGNGMILIYDNRLWNLIYSWVSSLSKEIFMELLPLLRRTFSKFEFGERRQIGEKAKKGLATERHSTATAAQNFNEERAALILPIIKELAGFNS
ncbi:MAG: hypothetical protein JW783_02465 [Bacteroidales bacterium]|nr:hypothetical protein [Bacteroidales bacterium]MBN2749823.1 hypothetical protein [Bacteroidales bacterium]